jgi:hypothetical protein
MVAAMAACIGSTLARLVGRSTVGAQGLRHAGSSSMRELSFARPIEGGVERIQKAADEIALALVYIWRVGCGVFRGFKGSFAPCLWPKESLT